MSQQATSTPSRRDHLWVVAIIAAFAMYDVWGSWTHIGNESGFAHGTGWTLTVIVEAYWGYALYAWLVAAAGKRSRRFAMWTAIGVFILSLVGQGASHLTERQLPPTAIVVFVSVLPVTILALIALLIHMRLLDRAEADELASESALERALADEREARQRMAAELASFRQETAQELESAAQEMAGVRQQLAAETARADGLARKLETARQSRKATPARTTPREEVAGLLKEDPGISILAASKRLKRSRDTLKPIFDELRPGGEIRAISEARHA